MVPTPGSGPSPSLLPPPPPGIGNLPGAGAYAGGGIVFASAGDALTWPFGDPGWLRKVAVMGLICLLFIVPVIGWIIVPMAVLGWMLISLDNLRAGRRELAPAGFHLRRGAPLFVVLVVYGLGLLVVVTILGALTGGLSGSSSRGAGGGVAQLVNLVGGLALTFLFPSIALATERGGIGAGLNLPAVVDGARLKRGVTVIAGLFLILTEIIGALGLIACLIGVIFTIAYAYAVNAGLIRWYETQSGAVASTAIAGPV